MQSCNRVYEDSRLFNTYLRNTSQTSSLNIVVIINLINKLNSDNVILNLHDSSKNFKYVQDFIESILKKNLLIRKVT